MNTVSAINKGFDFGLLSKKQNIEETTGSVANKGVETTGSVADARKKTVEPLFNFASPETTGSVASNSFSMVA